VPWHRFAPGRETANVAAQTGDPESLLSRYRDLIRLRQQNPALRAGDYAPVTLADGGRTAVAYLRETATQRVLVVHNLAGEPTTIAWTLATPAGGYELLFGDRGVGLPAADAITLPARSAAVWELTP
jgi:glycosidase